MGPAAAGLPDLPAVPFAAGTKVPRRSGCSDGRVLVLQDGRLVGIISPSDIARTPDLAALRRPRAGLGPDTLGKATHG